MTRLESLAGVLGVPVRVESTCIGHVAGVVGDSGFGRVIGLDVAASDGSRKFLPWVAASVARGEILVSSALVLFDTLEIEGYTRQGAVTMRSPAELASLAVTSDGSVSGFHSA